MLTDEAPPPLDPQQPVLYIECCQSQADYRHRALELHLGLAEALRAMNPEVRLQLRLNENNAAREGAFEVAIAATPTADVDARHMLWTGLRRVPQSAKVPNVDDIIAPACLVLKLRHSQAGSSSINLVRTSDGEISKIIQRHGRRSL
ncbi:selenoprotein BthD [Drosophila grimshawi]|uniref:GH10147 n=1 Tax=Drosophila grimshawi TaxID=7222 RepID=B4JC97_DROGR|nr:selenoprotein BthD [Drosophila grimshawi]EDW04130.1 GH10147 [Drosophila grimshawi]